QETIEDMDRDGDGFIQEDEYIADLYEGLPGAPEPPWVQLERSQFRTGRDRDGDGRLGPEEVGGWLRPPRSDWAAAEAEHLVLRADGDQDGQLSRGEIMGHWQLFVGSQATSYGEDLQRPHDEL
ncbi:RCN3 protein, partial [Rhinopomastus cyanomelas]|nr:RCN3 protein [Rhinopomastus cyanomelas]